MARVSSPVGYPNLPGYRTVPTGVPDILPNVSGVYRKKVQRLVAALNEPKDQAEAAEAIRGLIEKITLRPGPERGEIDVNVGLGGCGGGQHPILAIG